MEFKLLKTENDYHKAIQKLEEIGDHPDFQSDERLFDSFELLAKLIEDYETAHFPIQPGDPIEIIKLRMTHMGLTRKDLESIASSGVLSEVFNKKRSLSKKMIRELSVLLKIDQDLLNPPTKQGTAAIVKPLEIQIEKTLRKKRPSFKFLKAGLTSVRGYAEQIRENNMVFNINVA